MRRRKIFYGANLLILVSLSLAALLTMPPAAPNSSAAQSPPPMIYYFSEADNGLIVEAADGSQRQILAPYDLPADKDMVGPGWSPSGQWFAWTTAPIGLPYLMDNNIHLINRAGGDVIQISTNGTTLVMEWSPIDDLLLLLSQDTEGHLSYFLYNPESEIFTFEVTLPVIETSSPPFLNYFASWSPNGEFIEIGFPASVGVNVRIVSKNGRLIKEMLVGCKQAIYYPCYDAIWWMGNQIAYIEVESNHIVVENFLTGEVKQIPIPSANIRQMFWDAAGKFAIIAVGNAYSIDDGSQATWSLSTANQTVIPLPLDPHTAFYEWSPDGNQAVFNLENQLLLLESDNAVLEEVLLPIEGNRFASPEWIDNQAILIYVYENAPDFPLQELFLYETATHELNQLGYDSLVLPPENAHRLYLFSFDAPTCFLACITELKTGITTIIEPNSSTTEINFINAVYWHPIEKWLFLFERTDDGIRQIVVANQDGSVVRGLETRCNISVACYGWMPSIP